MLLRADSPRDPAPAGTRFCVGAVVDRGKTLLDLEQMPTLLFDMLPLEVRQSLADHLKSHSPQEYLRFFLVYFYGARKRKSERYSERRTERERESE